MVAPINNFKRRFAALRALTGLRRQVRRRISIWIRRAGKIDNS